jgi:hypothetical protein
VPKSIVIFVKIAVNMGLIFNEFLGGRRLPDLHAKTFFYGLAGFLKAPACEERLGEEGRGIQNTI